MPNFLFIFINFNTIEPKILYIINNSKKIIFNFFKNIITNIS
jgi:hypothetical protein